MEQQKVNYEPRTDETLSTSSNNSLDTSQTTPTKNQLDITPVPLISPYEKEEQRNLVEVEYDGSGEVLVYKHELLQTKNNRVYQYNPIKQSFYEVGTLIRNKPNVIDYYPDIIDKYYSNKLYLEYFNELVRYNDSPTDSKRKNLIDNSSIITEIFNNDILRTVFILDLAKTNKLQNETLLLLIEIYNILHLGKEQLLFTLYNQGSIILTSEILTFFGDIHIYKDIETHKTLWYNLNSIPLITILLDLDSTLLDIFGELHSENVSEGFYNLYYYVYYKEILVFGEPNLSKRDFEKWSKLKTLLNDKTKTLLWQIFRKPANRNIISNSLHFKPPNEVDFLYTVKHVTDPNITNVKLFIFTDNPKKLYRSIPLFNSLNLQKQPIYMLEYLSEWSGSNATAVYKNSFTNKLKYLYLYSYINNLYFEFYDTMLVQYDNSLLLDRMYNDCLFHVTTSKEILKFDFKGILSGLNPLKVEFLEEIDLEDTIYYKALDNIYEKNENSYRLIGKISITEPLEFERFYLIPHSVSQPPFGIVSLIPESSKGIFYTMDPHDNFIYVIYNNLTYDIIGYWDCINDTYKSLEDKVLKYSLVERKKFCRTQVDLRNSIEHNTTLYKLNKLIKIFATENITNDELNIEFENLLGVRDDYISRKQIDELYAQIKIVKKRRGSSLVSFPFSSVTIHNQYNDSSSDSSFNNVSSRVEQKYLPLEKVLEVKSMSEEKLVFYFIENIKNIFTTSKKNQLDLSQSDLLRFESELKKIKPILMTPRGRRFIIGSILRRNEAKKIYQIIKDYYIENNFPLEEFLAFLNYSSKELAYFIDQKLERNIFNKISWHKIYPIKNSFIEGSLITLLLWSQQFEFLDMYPLKTIEHQSKTLQEFKNFIRGVNILAVITSKPIRPKLQHLIKTQQIINKYKEYLGDDVSRIANEKYYFNVIDTQIYNTAVRILYETGDIYVKDEDFFTRVGRIVKINPENKQSCLLQLNLDFKYKTPVLETQYFDIELDTNKSTLEQYAEYFEHFSFTKINTPLDIQLSLPRLLKNKQIIIDKLKSGKPCSIGDPNRVYTIVPSGFEEEQIIVEKKNTASTNQQLSHNLNQYQQNNISNEVEVEEEELYDEDSNPEFIYHGNNYVYYRDHEFNDVYLILDRDKEVFDIAGKIINREPLTVQFNNGLIIEIPLQTSITSLESSKSVFSKGENQENKSDSAIEETNPEFHFNGNDYVYFKDNEYNEVYKVVDRENEELELAGVILKREPYIIKFNDGIMVQISIEEENEEENDDSNPEFSYKGQTYVYYSDSRYNQVYLVVNRQNNTLELVGKVVSREPIVIEFNHGAICKIKDGICVENNVASSSSFSKEEEEEEETNPEFTYKGNDYVYYQQHENPVVFLIKNREQGSLQEIGKIIKREPFIVEFNDGTIVEIKNKAESQNSDYYKSGEKSLTEYEAGEGKARRTYGYDNEGNVFVKFRGIFVKQPVGKVIRLKPFEVEYYRLAKPKKEKEQPKYNKPGEIDVVVFTQGKGKFEKTYGYDKENQVFKMYRGNWEAKPVGKLISKDPITIEFFRQESETTKNISTSFINKDKDVEWQKEYEDWESISYKSINYMINFTTNHVFVPTLDDEFEYVGNVVKVTPLEIHFFEEDVIGKKYGGLFSKNEQNEVFDKKNNKVGYWDTNQQDILFIPLRAFLNESSSCYINTVLFALLYRQNKFIQSKILQRNLNELYEEAEVKNNSIKEAIQNNKNELIRINQWLHSKEQNQNVNFVCKPFRKQFQVIHLDKIQSAVHHESFERGYGETNGFLEDLFYGFNIKTLVKTEKTYGITIDDSKDKLNEITNLVPPMIHIKPNTPLEEIFVRTTEEVFDFDVLQDLPIHEFDLMNIATINKMILGIKATLEFLKTKTRVKKAVKNDIAQNVTSYEQKIKNRNISTISKNEKLQIYNKDVEYLNALYKPLNDTIKNTEKTQIDIILKSYSDFNEADRIIDDIKRKFSKKYNKRIDEIMYTFNKKSSIDTSYLVLWVDRSLQSIDTIGKSKESYDIQNNIDIDGNKLELQYIIKHIDNPKHFVCYFKNILDELWYVYDDSKGTFKIVKKTNNIGTFEAMKDEAQNDCVLLFYSKN